MLGLSYNFVLFRKRAVSHTIMGVGRLKRKTLFLTWAVIVILNSSSLASVAPTENLKVDDPVTFTIGNLLKKAPDMSFYRFDLKAVNGVLQTGTHDYVILDVRDNESFVAEHIPTAINIFLPMLTDQLKGIPPNKPIYVIAASDCDSAYATFALRMLGYHAYMIPGGQPGWKAAGYSLVSGTK